MGFPNSLGGGGSAGIVINGLAIHCRSDVCSGRPVRYDLKGAFAVTVDGQTSFTKAVRRKLVMEIAMGKQ